MAPSSARQLLRRAAAAAKDKRTFYLTRVASTLALRRPDSGNFDLDMSIIRATSHDDRGVDCRSAALVLSCARASPALLRSLMWSLSRRVTRTRSWAVALKSLLLAHGLLLRSDDAPASARIGRLPFDLSDFADRWSPTTAMSGVSAFVRAYFQFLDARSLFAADGDIYNGGDGGDEDARLRRVKRFQLLLDLLMEIRPRGRGAMDDNRLILEAMDCVVIEIFEVYSQICSGIARFLVSILGSSSSTPASLTPEELEARRLRGRAGMLVVRKATEQGEQLSSYFELCRELGVLNAAEFPVIERVPEEDIAQLEKLVADGVAPVEQDPAEEIVAVASPEGSSKTVVTKEWVVFDDDDNSHVSSRAAAEPPSWAVMVAPAPFTGDLIELY